MVVKIIFRLPILIFLGWSILLSQPQKWKWLKTYDYKTDFRQDSVFRNLCREVVPENWQSDVFDRLTGPFGEAVLHDNRYAIFSSCKFQSCVEKLFIWVDIDSNKAVFALAYQTETPSPVEYLSNFPDKESLSGRFKSDFSNWLLENHIRISDETFYSSYSNSKPEFEEKDLTVAYKKAMKRYKNGDKESALSILNSYLSKSENRVLNENTVAIINDYGFFLFENGKNVESEEVLKEVLQKFPNRTVAWLNLADAQWAQEKKAKAAKSYESYIHLMKKEGKEKRIPARVLKRVP